MSAAHGVKSYAAYVHDGSRKELTGDNLEQGITFEEKIYPKFSPQTIQQGSDLVTERFKKTLALKL